MSGEKELSDADSGRQVNLSRGDIRSHTHTLEEIDIVLRVDEAGDERITLLFNERRRRS